MTQDILFERKGGLGLVTLNRAKALNALTLEMANAHKAQLDLWAKDPDVTAVVIRGAGDKAFCAGGDIMALHASGVNQTPVWEQFFRDEYVMNHRIGAYPKPYIALIYGIVMGGGVGLSVHGGFRIATEKTLFAMPECGIGLIPDVGGTHLLGHMPGALGVFLGVTGERLKAADCLWAGVATHYMPSDKLDDFIDALAQTDIGCGGCVETALKPFRADPGPSTLAERASLIDAHFSFDRLEAIFESLSLEQDPWMMGVRDRMMTLSPTSMKLALRSIREARGKDLAGCLTTEYRIVSRIKSGVDFFEGVRAALIDKDKTPRWRPAAIGDVTDTMVAEHFQTPPWGDVTFA
jgi:enoyl-CoA hydratase